MDQQHLDQWFELGLQCPNGGVGASLRGRTDWGINRPRNQRLPEKEMLLEAVISDCAQMHEEGGSVVHSVDLRLGPDWCFLHGNCFLEKDSIGRLIGIGCRSSHRFAPMPHNILCFLTVVTQAEKDAAEYTVGWVAEQQWIPVE